MSLHDVIEYSMTCWHVVAGCHWMKLVAEMCLPYKLQVTACDQNNCDEVFGAAVNGYQGAADWCLGSHDCQ